MKLVGDYAAGYAHLQELVPQPVAREFLARVSEDIKRSGYKHADLLRDAPPLKRPALELYGYEHAPTLTFLWGLTPTMCAVTGRDLLPSYSYFRVYRQGDLLRVHSDRDACEHSLSLTLGYSDNAPWAFEIARARVEKAESIADAFGPAGATSIVMQPGDAVLYQGVHYRHGRTTPNPNRWSAHLCLHWVDRDGPYKDQAFDGRATAAPIEFEI